MDNQGIKVLLAKVGLDNQDKEIRLLARSLKNQGGIKVIYTGLYCTLEEIVQSALQEKVDLVGVSVHNGSHNEIFPRLRGLLDAKKASDILVFGGGMIPEKHRQELKASGVVDEIFGPSTSISIIVDWIYKQWLPRRKKGILNLSSMVD
ncbi:cobalamin B12-binding domain protein [Desulforamulus reducens MI-1]|uniref:Cobalamin B12-binding domain protein n=1 Tax=Desulforamulus reducens (strain ATCC BAA-1160 / DSM 100696 / MI-1) TaxID=349161 RepID=A4J5E3_DESRM|nr:cobalamin-dependent protein [Desulforamulus reducens]ABO50296.1 cobalamin B12-binding domain protein [Desulforamulus reducens MI-1]